MGRGNYRNLSSVRLVVELELKRFSSHLEIKRAQEASVFYISVVFAIKGTRLKRPRDIWSREAC